MDPKAKPADQRDSEEPIGKAHQDEADFSELNVEQSANDDHEPEGGGERAGMGRGEKPRKPKARSKH